MFSRAALITFRTRHRNVWRFFSFKFLLHIYLLFIRVYFFVIFLLDFLPSFDLLSKYCSLHVHKRQTICLIVTINHPRCKLLLWKRFSAAVTMRRRKKCNSLVCWNWSLYWNLFACRIIDLSYSFFGLKTVYWTLSLVVAVVVVVVVRLLGFRPDLRFNIFKRSACGISLFMQVELNQGMGWFVVFCFYYFCLLFYCF